jgi:hypothetical protein
MCVCCAFCVRFLCVLCGFKLVTSFIRRQAVYDDECGRPACFVAFNYLRAGYSEELQEAI